MAVRDASRGEQTTKCELGTLRRGLSTARLGFLWLAGADMRMAVLGLPPVLPEIRHALQLSEGTVGVLTTLPVLLLALGAVGGSAAVARLGPRRALALGLVVVGASSALRGAGGETALFVASVALGAGIAVLQPAMPSMARLWFPSQVGFATSVYSNGMVAGEAIAASLTIPLVLPLTGMWRLALAFWALPAFGAAALLIAPFAKAPPAHDLPTTTAVGEPSWEGPLPAMAGALESPGDPPASRWWPRWDDAVTWRVGLLQGGGSVLYFGTNAYLSTELHATGRPGLVAPCLAALNTSQLLASLIVAVLSRSSARPHRLLAACGAGGLSGLAAVVWAPPGVAIAGCALIGCTSAVCFVVSLALPPLLVPPEEVHKMAAATSTIGYVAAFALPLAGGFAWDATGHPALAFGPPAAGAVLLGLVLIWPGRAARRLATVRVQ